MATSNSRLGDSAKAAQIFQDAIRRNPDNDQYYLSLALVQLRGGNLAEAETTLNRGLARVPSSGKILWGLGVVSALRGNSPQAASQLERAVDLLPEWSGSYSALGVFYYQTGQYDKAREVFSRFKGSHSSGGFDMSRIEQALANAPANFRRHRATSAPFLRASNSCKSRFRSPTARYDLRAQSLFASQFLSPSAFVFSPALRPEFRPRANSQKNPTPSIPVRFTDIRKQAGITFLQDSTQTEEKFYLETMGTGVGWLDYDQDGLMDLYFVQSGPTELYKPDHPMRSALYHNNGDGTFTDVTEKAGVAAENHYGQGVAIADYDNDGYPDIYVTGYQRAILYHNNGDGTFTDVTAKAGVADEGDWSTSAAWFDYDHDGYLDLVVAQLHRVVAEK